MFSQTLRARLTTRRSLRGLIVVSLCPLSWATVAWPQTLSPEESEALLRGREKKRDQQKGEEEQYQRTIQQHLDRIKEVTEVLGQLEAKAQVFLPRMGAMLTNDDGKRLAHNDAATLEFLRIREERLVTMEQIKAKQQALQAVTESLAARLKLHAGYAPDDTQKSEVEGFYYWAQDRLGQITAYDAWLTENINRAPKDLDLKKVRTLEATINAFLAARLQFLADLREKGVIEAREESADIIQANARIAEAERLREGSERDLREARAETARKRTEFEQVLKFKEAENSQRVAKLEGQILEINSAADSRLKEAQMKFDDETDELKRKLQAAEARRYSENTNSQIAHDDIISEADQRVLEQRCRDLQVKALLAPFLDRGYGKPYLLEGRYIRWKRYDKVDPVPLSLSDLRQLGALERTARGFTILQAIASSDGDNRSRWSGGDWQKNPELKDRIEEAQKQLIELGSTLVKLDMLQK